MKNGPYPLYEMDFPANNLKEFVNYCAEKYDGRIAFRYREGKGVVDITFARFGTDVNALGLAFYDLGLRDSKIAIIGENSYMWLVTYFAIVSGGNIAVPIDVQLPADEVSYILEDSAADAFVFSDAYADIAVQVKDRTLTVKNYINIKKDMPLLLEKGAKLLEQDGGDFKNMPLDEKRLAAIVYTSGTTGRPKGVMLSHKNFIHNAVNGCRMFYARECNVISILPLHHTLSFTPGLLAPLMGGCTVAINGSIRYVNKDLVEFKPEFVVLVPLVIETMYKKVWETAKEQGKESLLKTMIRVSNFLLSIGIDLRRKLFKSVLEAFGGELELIVSGGAPMPEECIKGFRDFGIYVIEAYGTTECTPGVTMNRNNYWRDGSVGLPICCEVKIASPDKDGVGEICVKGDNVMLGYYNNEQATKEAFDDDGWLKTGDLGYIDKDGFLFITGRIKNLIILSNGKNVSPEELEFKLIGFEYIKEVLVYGEGEHITAEIFLDTESFPDCRERLDADILELNRTLPQYKNITKTVVRDTEFPKTTTKKIQRRYQ